MDKLGIQEITMKKIDALYEIKDEYFKKLAELQACYYDHLIKVNFIPEAAIQIIASFAPVDTFF